MVQQGVERERKRNLRILLLLGGRQLEESVSGVWENGEQVKGQLIASTQMGPKRVGPKQRATEKRSAGRTT